MGVPLSPLAKRWRTIIVTVPVIGATSFVLYKRLVLGEPRRTLKPNQELVPLNPYKHTEPSNQAPSSSSSSSQ